MKKILSVSLSTLSLLLILSVTTAAQVADEEQNATPPTVQADGRLALEQADRDRPTMKDVVIEKKITGRLPNGYRNIVTTAQREDIYKIQREYNEMIELLKLRIEMLEQERDKRVDGLLTAEQVQKVRQTRGVLESEKHQAAEPSTGRPGTRRRTNP